MKIGLVYDAVYPWVMGGGEKHLWEIAIALQRRGHEVHLFGMKYWAGPSSIQREGVCLHGVCRARKLYNDAGKRSLWQPIAFAAGLFLTLMKNPAGRLDVIDSIAFPYFSLFAVAVWRRLTGAGTGWIITWLEVWGEDYWSRYLSNNYAARVGAWIERASARLGDRHLCISRHQAKRLQALLGVTPEAIEVIARGVDFSNLPSASGNLTNLIYCGRLLGYKNVDMLVRALPAIRAVQPEVRLTILGDGPEAPKLKTLVAQLGLEKAVDFRPFASEVADGMQEIADGVILLQPSTREGLSMVVLEAQAIGVPVIAADHPESAVSDLITSGKNGLLVARWDDPEEWALSVIRLLSDQALYGRIREKARESVQAFDLEGVVMPRLEEAYRLVSVGR